MVIIAQRIRALRLERNESLKEFGRQTLISHGLLSHYERGTTVPGYWNMLEIARHFNVSLDYLAGITEERKEYPHG